MTRSGELDLAKTPVHVVTAGTLGSGDLSFPSAAGKVEGAPSRLVGMDQQLPPSEKNGFTIIDVTPDAMTFQLFACRPPQPVDLIDTMDPIAVHTVPRAAETQDRNAGRRLRPPHCSPGGQGAGQDR
jgi:hypothetical protein